MGLRERPITQRVLNMTIDGVCIYCIFHHDNDKTPYYLYCKWYYYNGDRDYGYKTKLIAKYSSMLNVIDHIRNFLYNQIKGGATDV